MAQSGVVNSDDIPNLYKEMQLNKAYQYLTFKIEDKHIIKDVAQSGRVTLENVEDAWGKFLSDLPDEECRFCIVDFAFDKGEDGYRHKLIMVSWSPDCAPVRNKMLYSASKEAFKKPLNGIDKLIHAADKGDLIYAQVLQDINRK